MSFRICFISLMVCLSACETGPSLPTTTIENITLIDPVDGAMAGQRIVIEGDRIASVESMSVSRDSNGEVIDGSGRFLIPGLWDMHVHFLYDESLTEIMPRLFLDYGVTSVRDTGGDLDRMVALRTSFSQSSEPEPDLYFSGPLLDGRFVVYDGADPGRPKLGTGVPDSTTGRATVAHLKSSGADFIKIYELIAPEVFESLAAAANDMDLPIAAHVPLMMTADSAGPAVDSMEHLRNIELACADNWKSLLATRQATIERFEEGRGYDLRRTLHTEQRVPAIENYDEVRCDQVLKTLTDTIQVPTLRLNTVATALPFEHPQWSMALSDFPESTRNLWLENARQLSDSAPLADPVFADWSLFLISRLLVNQVPIGAGTDTPIGLGIPGWSLHTELEMLVKGGMSELQALYAATVQPTRFFNIEDRMGRIQPGMKADLVLLDANPLENIRNTRRVNRVMLNGVWVR
jgi:hypothetical protein